jgi:hypothetical protein
LETLSDFLCDLCVLCGSLVNFDSRSKGPLSPTIPTVGNFDVESTSLNINPWSKALMDEHNRAELDTAPGHRAPRRAPFPLHVRCRIPALPLWTGLLFLFASSYIQQQPPHCPTPLSRLDMLHALAHGHVEIDAYRANTTDVAEYEGHYYSDKAPGTVVLAWPAFAASAAALRAAGVGLGSKPGWLYSSWAATIGSNGVVAALGMGLLLAWLSKHAGARPASISALAVYLGAAPLPYATMMFSHALVVGLIAISMWAGTRGQERDAKSEEPTAGRGATTQNRSRGALWVSLRSLWSSSFWSKRDLLAGFACGWALASEYTSGLIIIGIGLWLMSQGWRRLIPFCLAAIPPVLLIPLYSWLCFRHPFILPYSLNASFPEMKQGLYAIKWPDAQTAFNLLFSPARGLFFWSPFLLMAGAGYWALAGKDKRLFWLTYAAPVVQIVVISGRTWDWPAGPTLGPRYLAPILPLLALPCALGVRRFPKVGMLLAAYSIAITTLATLTNASPPFPNHPDPLFDLNIPMFLHGQFQPNLGTVVGLPPFVSVALYYAILAAGIFWLWRLSAGDSGVCEMRETPRDLPDAARAEQ